VEWLGLVRFHDLEKGECPAIVRPKEIQMCGVFPTLETVSSNCMPAEQVIDRTILWESVQQDSQSSATHDANDTVASNSRHRCARDGYP
jgi:hypothetical protein